MRLKKNYNILGHDIPVKRQKKIFVNNKQVAGCWDPNSETAYVMTPLCENQRIETWLHEMVHAIATIQDIDLKEDKEHDDVQKIAMGFLSLIRDNDVDLRRGK